MDDWIDGAYNTAKFVVLIQLAVYPLDWGLCLIHIDALDTFCNSICTSFKTSLCEVSCDDLGNQ